MSAIIEVLARGECPAVPLSPDERLQHWEETAYEIYKRERYAQEQQQEDSQ